MSDNQLPSRSSCHSLALDAHRTPPDLNRRNSIRGVQRSKRREALHVFACLSRHAMVSFASTENGIPIPYHVPPKSASRSLTGTQRVSTELSPLASGRPGDATH